jgi:hypothetical protein
MKERTKALLGKNKNELPAARKLYVSLDRADNVIEGGPVFDFEFRGALSFVVGRAGPLSTSSPLESQIKNPALAAASVKDGTPALGAAKDRAP